MTARVINFRHRSDSVVGLLGQMIEDAKDGQIVAIAICGVTEDDFIFNHWFDGSRWAELVGACEVLKHDLVTQAADQS